METFTLEKDDVAVISTGEPEYNYSEDLSLESGHKDIGHRIVIENNPGAYRQETFEFLESELQEVRFGRDSFDRLNESLGLQESGLINDEYVFIPLKNAEGKLIKQWYYISPSTASRLLGLKIPFTQEESDTLKDISNKYSRRVIKDVRDSEARIESIKRRVRVVLSELKDEDIIKSSATHEQRHYLLNKDGVNIIHLVEEVDELTEDFQAENSVLNKQKYNSLMNTFAQYLALEEVLCMIDEITQTNIEVRNPEDYYIPTILFERVAEFLYRLDINDAGTNSFELQIQKLLNPQTLTDLEYDHYLIAIIILFLGKNVINENSGSIDFRITPENDQQLVTMIGERVLNSLENLILNPYLFVQRRFTPEFRKALASSHQKLKSLVNTQLDTLYVKE